MADSSGMNLQDLLAQQAMGSMGYAAYPAIQRSQYLADALKAISDSAGQGNIKSPLALGSNLLAEALLQSARKGQDQQLTDQIGAAQNKTWQHYLQTSGYNGGDPSASPNAAAPSPVAPPPPPNFATPNAPPAPPPPPTQAAPGPLSPADQNAIVQTVWGEARGEPLAGQQAVAGVIENRAKLAGLPPSQIVAQPHQFAGYNARSQAIGPNSPEYQGILNNISPVLNGSANPAGTADHFYAPGGIPGGARPSWDNGTGQMIGHQNFLSLGYGGKPALGMPQQGGGMPPNPPPGSPQGGGGMPPPMLQPAGGPPPVPPGGPPMQAPPVPQPQGGAQGLPPLMGNPMNDMERQEVQYGMGAPVGSAPRARALQILQDVSERRATQRAYDMQTANGVPVATDTMTGRAFGVQLPSSAMTQATPGAPGTTILHDPTGKITYESDPNAWKGNALYTPGQGGAPGAYSVPPSLQPTVTGSPAAGSYVATPPGGAPNVVQQPQFDPEKARGQLASSTALGDYNQSLRATQGFFNVIQHSTQNTGLAGVAGVAAVLGAIHPGMNPRTTTNDQVLQSLGFPDQIQGAILHAVGNGIVTTDSLKQMASLALQYTSAARDSVMRQVASDTAAYQGLSGVKDGVPGEAQLVGGLPTMPSFNFSPQPPQPPPGVQGWPQGMDPRTPAGQAAMELVRRGYRFQNGQLVK